MADIKAIFHKYREHLGDFCQILEQLALYHLERLGYITTGETPDVQVRCYVEDYEFYMDVECDCTMPSGKCPAINFLDMLRQLPDDYLDVLGPYRDSAIPSRATDSPETIH